MIFIRLYQIIEKMQYKKLGKFIKSKRENLKISLNEFANAADVDPAIICRIENLKQGIKIDCIIKIAKVFNQTAGEFLLEFEKSKYYNK